ncbi:MAG TPA: dipeptidase PepV [Firmicutes bacterium]|nr:dipeptidase PepV [Bacillota bacterium]
MDFLNRIERDQEEMVTVLRDLISIPSVKDEPVENGPFGKEIAKALDYVLAWGEKQGFSTKNFSGYAGHLEYGEGEETVGVLVHVDVVPAGDGWTYGPFSGTIAEGRIYGRGTVDDKGPAVAVMYALKALKETEVGLKRKIRIIFGCDEESGWACMDHYFKHEKKPTWGFAPDAEFPLINCEKGMLGLDLDGEAPSTPPGQPQLLQLQGGERRNVVPDYAEAVIFLSEPEVERSARNELTGYFNQIAADDAKFQWQERNGRFLLRAYGVAAHASLPQLGENALIKLARILADLNYQGGAWDLLHFIARNIGPESNGRELGIACSDERSGELTLNLGVVAIKDGRIHLELDIRYPMCTNAQFLTDQIRKGVAPLKLTVKPAHSLKPHYVPVDDGLVQILLRAYRSETNDSAQPLSIGGRTYAVALGNGVAFGPVFPGRPELAHKKDEYISLTDLYACARIYARALYELATK